MMSRMSVLTGLLSIFLGAPLLHGMMVSPSIHIGNVGRAGISHAFYKVSAAKAATSLFPKPVSGRQLPAAKSSAIAVPKRDFSIFDYYKKKRKEAEDRKWREYNNRHLIEKINGLMIYNWVMPSDVEECFRLLKYIDFTLVDTSSSIALARKLLIGFESSATTAFSFGAEKALEARLADQEELMTILLDKKINVSAVDLLTMAVDRCNVGSVKVILNRGYVSALDLQAACAVAQEKLASLTREENYVLTSRIYQDKDGTWRFADERRYNSCKDYCLNQILDLLNPGRKRSTNQSRNQSRASDSDRTHSRSRPSSSAHSGPSVNNNRSEDASLADMRKFLATLKNDTVGVDYIINNRLSLLKKYHPDLNIDLDTPEKKVVATQITQIINNKYDAYKNMNKRI